MLKSVDDLTHGDMLDGLAEPERAEQNVAQYGYCCSCGCSFTPNVADQTCQL